MQGEGGCVCVRVSERHAIKRSSKTPSCTRSPDWDEINPGAATPCNATLFTAKEKIITKKRNEA